MAEAPRDRGEITKKDGKPVWAIGGDRMKAAWKHSVPLTPQMVALLGEPKPDHVQLSLNGSRERNEFSRMAISFQKRTPRDFSCWP